MTSPIDATAYALSGVTGTDYERDNKERHGLFKDHTLVESMARQVVDTHFREGGFTAWQQLHYSLDPPDARKVSNGIVMA